MPSVMLLSMAMTADQATSKLRMQKTLIIFCVESGVSLVTSFV
jgi:hypothetical protein